MGAGNGGRENGDIYNSISNKNKNKKTLEVHLKGPDQLALCFNVPVFNVTF